MGQLTQPGSALRRFTLVRDHNAPMASFRPALTEAPQRKQPHWSRPVNSGPRPCLIDVGFPLSGLQDRTHTSDLNVRARHTHESQLGYASLVFAAGGSSLNRGSGSSSIRARLQHLRRSPFSPSRSLIPRW
jgi:hypothetical protein